MAEVAAVYTLKQWPRTIEDILHGLRSKETEAQRPRPTSKRVWARIAHSAQHVILRLRALRTSGDFDDYWLFHLAKEHERTHPSRDADAKVPNPLLSTRPHLTLVK